MPNKQKAQINKILNREREKIICKFNNTIPKNESNNKKINTKFPYNAPPLVNSKIKALFKKENLAVFAKKYEQRKSSATININKRKSDIISKSNIKKKRIRIILMLITHLQKIQIQNLLKINQ